MKHTPGPWRVGDGGHAVFGPKGSGMYPNAPITIVQALANKANTHLIAAAPDLLAFAKHVLEEQLAHGKGGDEEYIRMAEQAIAKAEGRE